MQGDKGESFEKRVAFKATDDERRVAIGGVMVPDKVDLQGDFLRTGLIESFSDGFMERLQTGDGEAVPGVMHAVFPEGHVTLSENRVLESAHEIGGKEFPAGSWVQGWKFSDDELWGLVQDGVLSGYSIGATDVKWSEAMAQEDLPDDVEIAADYPEDEQVWQILDGTVGEVSSVDIPAVPDAVMVAAKAGGAKSILDHVGGKNEFVGVMQDRGHDEDAAERLWHYLQRALDETDGKAAPTPSDSVLTRWGRSMWDAITRGDGDGGGAKTATTDGGAEKESRTLSTANRERLMAAHDALEDALASDVDFVGNRFTDNPTTDFDVADYGGKAAPTDKDAPGGDTSDSDDTTMSDDDPLADAPEWAKAMHNDIEENSKHIDDLADKVTKTDDPDDPEKAWEDAPAWAKALRDEQKDLDERVEGLAEASGKSQQEPGAGTGGESEGPTKADILGIPGGDA